MNNSFVGEQKNTIVTNAPSDSLYFELSQDRRIFWLFYQRGQYLVLLGRQRHKYNDRHATWEHSFLSVGKQQVAH